MYKSLVFNFAFLIVLLTLAGCSKKPVATDEQVVTDTAETATVVPTEQTKVVNALAYDDITGLTPEDKELSLSELVGKTDYVLLDFWASWCGPCRRFVPVLKDIYARMPKGRLQILSCSVDQDPIAWRVALQEESMPWPQMREDAEHPCSDKYNVQFIPHTVLFDKEGNIVAVNPEEPDLENFLLGQ